jgi:hypothetical protein
MSHRLVPLLAVLACTAACEPGVPAQSQLLTTRVLAIRADPPELVVPQDGGLPQPVHFSVLAFAPDGGTPVVTLALCLTGNPYGAGFECPGADGITLPDDTLDVANPEILALLGALDGGLPDAGLTPAEPGVLQVAIGYLATTGTGPGESEVGVYRLSVRFSGNPNHNPQLLSVTVPDGGSLDGALLPFGQNVILTPGIPQTGPDSDWPSVGIDGGIETYSSLDGGLVYEHLNYSWYATLPNVTYFRSREPTPVDTAETAYSQFNGADFGPVTFYVVLRDDRGGTDWKVLDAGVLPTAPVSSPP